MLGVNEINLLQAQNEGLKKQNKELQEEIKKYAAINEQETKDYAELKAENERLKKLKCKFKEYCTCNTEKYIQTLQEIKGIAEEWMKDYCYLDNFKDKEGCCICHENKDCYSYRLLKALTKAEEE